MLDAIANIFGKKKKRVLTEVHIKDPKILDKHLEDDRGFARGELAYEKALRQKLEKKLRQKKEVNVSKILSDQDRKIYLDQFKDAFSWRMFFKYTDWSSFSVISYNYQKEFGSFQDIITLKDGRLAVMIKTKEGKLKPIITGMTVKQLFRNFSGLANTAKKGYFIVNLDENARHVDNTDELEIPNVMIDGEGKVVLSETNYEPFIRQLAKSKSKINQLFEQIETAEEAFVRENEEKKILEMHNKLNIARAESYEGQMNKSLKDVHGVINAFRDVSDENAAMAQGKRISEDYNEQLETAKDELFAKIAHFFPKDVIDANREDFQDVAEWVMSVVDRPVPKPEAIPIPMAAPQPGDADKIKKVLIKKGAM